MIGLFHDMPAQIQLTVFFAEQYGHMCGYGVAGLIATTKRNKRMLMHELQNQYLIVFLKIRQTIHAAKINTSGLMLVFLLLTGSVRLC